jgi:hypothetical protein
MTMAGRSVVEPEQTEVVQEGAAGAVLEEPIADACDVGMGWELGAVHRRDRARLQDRCALVLAAVQCASMNAAMSSPVVHRPPVGSMLTYSCIDVGQVGVDVGVQVEAALLDLCMTAVAVSSLLTELMSKRVDAASTGACRSRSVCP